MLRFQTLRRKKWGIRRTVDVSAGDGNVSESDWKRGRVVRRSPLAGAAAALLSIACMSMDGVAVAQESPMPTHGGLFVASGGAPFFASGPVGRDDVIVALPVRFRQVARLRTEVHRDARLVFGHPGLAAGTPVFAATFSSQDPYMAGSAWCGVATTGGTYCVFGMGEHASIALAGDDYAPGVLNDYPDRASFLDVVTDDSAANEIPPLELVYRFRSSNRRGVELSIGVRFQGRISFLSNMQLSRASDGAVTLAARGGELRLTQAEGIRNADATIVTPPRDVTMSANHSASSGDEATGPAPAQ
jgi:hypothetical protein